MTVAGIHKGAKGRRTRAGIGIQDCNALLAGFVLEEAFLGTVVGRTCQAREVDEQRDLVQRVCGGLGWKIEVEGHLAIGGRGIVGELEELAAEGGDGSFCLNRH